MIRISEENIRWSDLNGTEQSAVELAISNYERGYDLEDAVRSACQVYNDGNAESDYEDEDFYGEEANYNKVLSYVRTKI